MKCRQTVPTTGDDDKKDRELVARSRLAGDGLLVGLVQALEAELDCARGLVDLLDVNLHALADLLHLPSARHGLGALMRLLQLALLVPDAPQQPLRAIFEI